MPITIAHPAAIIPLKKSRLGRLLPLSALVIGSLVPDLGYLGPEAFVGYTHTLSGMFLFGLPVSLLILWGYHTFLEPTLLRWLPQPHCEVWLAHREPLRWQQWGGIVAAILLGLLLHSGWDGMTNSRGWFVNTFPEIFRAKTYLLDGTRIRFFSVFKHISSVMGVTLLIYWYWDWFRTETGSPPPSLWQRGLIWVGLIVFITLVGWMLATVSIMYIGYQTFKDGLMWTLIALAAAMMGIGLYAWFLRRRSLL